MAAKPSALAEYLSGVSGANRAALDRLCFAIRVAAPNAVEGISYGMPAFLVDGKAVAGFAAAANHLSYFPMSGSVVAALAKDLKGFDTSKGTIRFTPEKPLSAALVKKLVRARLAEIKSKSRKTKPARAGVSQTDPAVEAFLRKLDHPLKKEIEAVRKILLGVSPSIREGIRWNAPSFRTTDFFATFFLRETAFVRLIFHTGAKAKGLSMRTKSILDPNGLIEWLAKDRCSITLGTGKALKANLKPFAAIVKAWIRPL